MFNNNVKTIIYSERRIRYRGLLCTILRHKPTRFDLCILAKMKSIHNRYYIIIGRYINNTKYGNFDECEIFRIILHGNRITSLYIYCR